MDESKKQMIEVAMDAAIDAFKGKKEKRKYEVVETIGKIGVKKRKGVVNTVMLRRVSWYGSQPFWDIREWTPDMKPGKGITLSDEMMEMLKKLLE